MKIKIFSILAAAAALTVTSCHQEQIVTPGEKPAAGKGEVSMRSMAVEINNAEKVLETKSSRATVDLSEYSVQILDVRQQPVQQWTYAEMPEVFALAEGKYKVVVKSHNVQPVEWERPYFTGEKEFEIVKNKITEVGIVSCRLSNVKVSVRFGDALLAKMGADCKVTVTAVPGVQAVFTAAETRSAYFDFVSSTMMAEFTGTVGGNYETVRLACTEVAAGQHRIITFNLKNNQGEDPDQNGGIDVGGVRLDVQTIGVNLNGNVSLSEEILTDDDRPGQEAGGGDNPGGGEEPTPQNTIKYTVEGASFDAVNPLTDHVVVTIDAPEGVEHLQVKIVTTNANFEAAVSDLLPMEFDLAYPGAYADSFSGLGFPVGNQVIGQKRVLFDISQFIPMLEDFPGTHSFQIATTDAKSMQLVKTLSFKAN